VLKCDHSQCIPLRHIPRCSQVAQVAQVKQLKREGTSARAKACLVDEHALGEGLLGAPHQHGQLLAALVPHDLDARRLPRRLLARLQSRTLVSTFRGSTRAILSPFCQRKTTQLISKARGDKWTVVREALPGKCTSSCSTPLRSNTFSFSLDPEMARYWPGACARVCVCVRVFGGRELEMEGRERWVLRGSEEEGERILRIQEDAVGPREGGHGTGTCIASYRWATIERAPARRRCAPSTPRRAASCWPQVPTAGCEWLSQRCRPRSSPNGRISK